MAKKLKGLDIAAFGDATKAASLIADTASSLQGFLHAFLDDANRQVEEHRKLMQAHLDKKDLRPHVNFKPLPKDNWAVSFNSEVYTIGPIANLNDLDDDDPHFYWTGPDEVKHPARTMFQALIAVVQDYCNVDTGPVT